MPVGATVAIAGAGLASGAMSSRAQTRAGQTVAQSTDRAADLQNRQFQQMLALQMPGYRRAEGAAGTYMQALGLGGNSAATVPASSLYGQQQGQQQGQPSYAGMMTGGSPTQGPPPWKAGPGGGVGAFNPVMEAQGGQATTQPVGQPQQVPAGGGSLDIYEQVRNTPGYQAQLDQGIKAIDRAAPLVGGMYSGRRMKALEAHGQQTFGGYYNDWMNRVGGLAGQAQTISQNVGQAGMQNAQNVSGLMMTGANARAQGMTNSANAWTGAIGDAVGAGMMLGGQRGWFK